MGEARLMDSQAPRQGMSKEVEACKGEGEKRGRVYRIDVIRRGYLLKSHLNGILYMEE